MDSFLAEDNLCGQTLLRLVSRGSGILAELQRLSQNIPAPFQQDSADAARYAAVLFDFAYLREKESFERRVSSSAALVDLDGELSDTFFDLLRRSYQLFESVVVYARDFNKFVDDLEQGFYIQHTLDSVLLDDSGRQLMCEALYLFGVMLLLLERHFPGPVRERMVVAFYRHSEGGSGVALDRLDDVLALCRSTGFVASGSGASGAAPRGYPESYFARLRPPRHVVAQVVGRMQNDDIYLQASSFPRPEHRSARLAQQGAMLYVTLYFAPELLREEDATMREIVDRHFSDNWVIAWYMGYVVDLDAQWSRYPAAKAALDNVLRGDAVAKLALRNTSKARESRGKLRGFLTQGRLTEEFLLEHLDTLMDCVRDANVALRWRLLHARAQGRQRREQLRAAVISAEDTISLLLETSQLEWRLKAMFQALLEKKEETWARCREQSADRLRELSQYFTGEVLLTRVRRDEGMVKWFAGVAETVESLNYEDEHATVTGRRIREVVRALEEVEGFEQLEESLQVKAFLEETRLLLRQMVRTVNVTSSVLSKLENVTDLAYGWELLGDYQSVIHSRIEADPRNVVLLRATFLKLASILDVPLTRISQCDSPDAISVAEFYSSELVHFVRRVVEVVPKKVFGLLRRIIEIQSERMQPIPMRIEADRLSDYAQPNERLELARLTYRVSLFTEGILAMKQTLLGVVQVDPREILEKGLRKELVQQVCGAMHEALVFRQFSSGELERVAAGLEKTLDTMRRSVEYIQDYIDLAGLKMWQEEIHRIVNFYVEQESNRFLKKKVLSRQSQYQSRTIPIPVFPALPVPKKSWRGRRGAGGRMSATFMGRVVNALLEVTDPCHTVYVPEQMTWYDGSSGEEVYGFRLTTSIGRAVGMVGAQGIDRLLSFHIVCVLKDFCKVYRGLAADQGPLLETLRDGLFPEWRIPEEGPRVYGTGVKRAQAYMLPLLECCRGVGQAQLLRVQFSRLLEHRSRADAPLLHRSLVALNDSIMNDVRRHHRKPNAYAHPAEDSALLGATRDLLDACGLADPLKKIYMTTAPLEGLPVVVLLFLISYLPKLKYDDDRRTLVRSKDKYPIDGAPVCAGLATLLKQCHPSYTRSLLAYLSQYVRTMVHGAVAASRGRPPDLPHEVLGVLVFVRQLTVFAGVSSEEAYAFFPPYVYDNLCPS